MRHYGSRSPSMKRMWLACIVGLAAASCTIPTGACGCSPVPYGVEVRGVVSRASGGPAANAIVRASIFDRVCSADGRGLVAITAPHARTDAAGRFVIYQQSPPVDSACVRVAVYADTAVASAVLASVERTGVRAVFGQPLVVALTAP